MLGEDTRQAGISGTGRELRLGPLFSGGSDAVLAASRRSAAKGLDRWGNLGGTKRPRQVEEFSVFLSVASARSAYPVESRQAVKTGHRGVMLGGGSNEWRKASNTRHSKYKGEVLFVRSDPGWRLTGKHLILASKDWLFSLSFGTFTLPRSSAKPCQSYPSGIHFLEIDELEVCWSRIVRL
jgi:hypothetical protein